MPNYYAITAAEEYSQLSATATGSGFSGLPSGLMAILSDDNDDPLKWRFTTSKLYLLDVTVQDDNSMSMLADAIHKYTVGSAYYVGAILTDTRQPVWINETRPLP